MIKPALMVLTWRNLDCCVKSIDTWKAAGLLENVEKIAYINEWNLAYRIALEDRGFTTIGSEQNLGIALAYKALIEACESDHFLFLEHDWKSFIPAEEAVKTLHDSCLLLDSGRVEAIRLRHRTNFGDPLYSRHLMHDVLSTHPQHAMDAVHWSEDPVSQYPGVFTKESFGETDFIISKAEHAAFTNNPTIYKTDFLRDKILPLTNIPGGTLESEIQNWWCKQNFNVGRPWEGVFTHAP